MKSISVLVVGSFFLLHTFHLSSAQDSNSTTSNTPAGESPAIPYVLNVDNYDSRLSQAADQKSRTAILEERWKEIKLAVAFCNVHSDMPFFSSLMLWNSGSRSWRKNADIIEGDLEANAPLEGAVLIVRGDVSGELESTADSVHIMGDLRGSLHLQTNAEVIIAGNVSLDAIVTSLGSLDVFVGGDMSGTIDCEESQFIWIHGDLIGAIKTGSPITRLHVMGDYTGTVQPRDDPSLLYIDIRGFASSASMRTINKMKYTEFNASVGFSDQPPGTYPKRSIMKMTRNWFIHTQRPEEP